MLPIAAEISNVWSAIIAVATLEEGKRYVKSTIGDHADISKFKMWTGNLQLRQVYLSL